MILSWVNNILYLAFGVALLVRKPYRSLHLVQLYAFGTAALTFLYLAYFYNWYFYLAVNIVGPALFLLAFWDVARREGRQAHYWLGPALALVFLSLVLPVSFVTKTYIPYIVANIFISFNILYVFVRKNPLLVTWSLFSIYELLMDFLKLFVPPADYRFILHYFGMWMSVLLVVTLLAIVIKDPVLVWLRKRLGNSPAFAGVSVDGLANVKQRNFGKDRQANDRFWSAASLTLHKASLLMRDLNQKDYLTPEELRFYLGMKISEMEIFLEKYNIKKIYLPGYPGSWLVRRKDVTNIK